MELDQYKYMFEAEDEHWWYKGNHEIFLMLLKKYNLLKDGINILDAGCGTGKWLSILKEGYNINETGIDYQQTALDYALTRGNYNLKQGDISFKMFDNSSFELISCFDVICNKHIDASQVIKNFYDYLTPQGHLLITVPAYQFLYSKHDEVVHTGKRYTKKQLRELLESHGFSVVKLSYLVSILFPLAFLKRITGKISRKDKEHNEVKVPPQFINKLFFRIMLGERCLLRNFNFPFGLTVMALAKKE